MLDALRCHKKRVILICVGQSSPVKHLLLSKRHRKVSFVFLIAARYTLSCLGELVDCSQKNMDRVTQRRSTASFVFMSPRQHTRTRTLTRVHQRHHNGVGAVRRTSQPLFNIRFLFQSDFSVLN